MSFSLGHKDNTVSTSQHPLKNARRVGWHLLARAQVDARSFPTKVRTRIPSEERHPQRQDPATCPHGHSDYRERNAHTRKTYCVECGTYLDSVLREIALEETRSASSNRDEELADRVLGDTTITKQQIDLATSLMLKKGWKKSHVCQTEIMSSQWWFNFSWIALIVQLRHQPHLFFFLIPIHPHIWLVKTYFYRQNQLNEIPLTPTASAAVDTKDTATLNARVVDDNDQRIIPTVLSSSTSSGCMGLVGDKISLFLLDWELAKVVLSCLIALDMLCQKMREAWQLFCGSQMSLCVKEGRRK